MPTKPAKPTDWAEVKKTMDMLYRDAAAHYVIPDEGFPLQPIEGRGWIAEIVLKKKPATK